LGLSSRAAATLSDLLDRNFIQDYNGQRPNNHVWLHLPLPQSKDVIGVLYADSISVNLFFTFLFGTGNPHFGHGGAHSSHSANPPLMVPRLLDRGTK